VTQAVTNLTNVFPSNTTANEVTIANNVGCSGGTIVFHISCGASAIMTGLKTSTFRYKDGAGNFVPRLQRRFFKKSIASPSGVVKVAKIYRYSS
jgi:hypothetical protein